VVLPDTNVADDRNDERRLKFSYAEVPLLLKLTARLHEGTSWEGGSDEHDGQVGILRRRGGRRVDIAD
jgi:hypothetical protein